MSYRTGTRANLKKIFPIKLNDNDKKNEDVISLCVAKAYNDAKRTFKGIKEEQRNEIKRELQNYFKCEKNWKDQKSFDDWHKKICDKLCDLRYGTETVKYGQAQKIVNMTFKYLYCLENYDSFKGSVDKFEQCFLYCHMPLDNYTLKWYKNEKRECKKKANMDLGEEYPIGETRWSNIKKDMYLEIQANIKKMLGRSDYKDEHNNILTPFKAEFYIWAEQQWIEAVELIKKQRIASCDNLYPRYSDEKLDIVCNTLCKIAEKVKEQFK